MYGMECIELSEYEISRLDYFMANSLAKILYGTRLMGPPDWTLWEAGCLPARTLISIAAIGLNRKLASLTPELSITKYIMNNIPTSSNFFKNNISSSIDMWGLQLIRSTQLPVPITKTKLNIELPTRA
jgi:hypothetical protein